MTREQMEKDARIIIANNGWGQHHAVRLAHWLLAALAAPVAAEPPTPRTLNCPACGVKSEVSDLVKLPAEPPSLVALVQEWQAAMRETFPDGFEDVAWTDQRIELAERSLFAWTPAQAEPPSPEFKPDWDMLEATRESLREHMAMLKGYNALVALIADDAYAMTFQSMAQYRSALLKALAPTEKLTWKCQQCADAWMQLSVPPKHPPICSCGAEMLWTQENNDGQ